MKGSNKIRLGLIIVMVSGLAAAPLMGCSDDEGSQQIIPGGDDDAGPSGGDDTGPSGGDDTGPSGGDDTGDDTGPSGGDDTGPPPGESDYVVLFDDTLALDSSGYSEVVEFDAPDGINSIAVTVSEGPPTMMYFITGWIGPDGFEIVPDGWESGGMPICADGCNNRLMMDPGAFATLAPNNPASQVDPGTHSMRVGAQSATAGIGETLNVATVRLTIHGKVDAAGAPSSGTLDLNFFFTGAGGWTADNAPDDPDFQNMVALMDEIYDQVHIDIGDIAFHDADPNYRVVGGIQSGTGELAQLFAKSERAELEGPSVFFVEGIDSGFGFIQDGNEYNQQMGGGILGISGGIPGPMIVDGTPRSGVAVDVDSSSAMGAPGIAHVTAHEIGHYLGLFHTTENITFIPGMPAHDPLPDTAEDDPSYLMHASGSGDLMSEWQGRVMRKNPWVY